MAKEELCGAVIALVGRLITGILTSCSSSRRHLWEPGAVSGHEAHRQREDASEDREQQPAPSGP